MLEALAHQHLKDLLQRSPSSWPHNLTLSRLVARSLRRRDNTLIQIEHCSQDSWWLGLLTPLYLTTTSVVLVLSSRQRKRFFQTHRPLFKKEGLPLACWEGSEPPAGEQIWVMNHSQLLDSYKKGYLKSRQLIFPEAEYLSEHLREAMSIQISPEDWEYLIRAYPSAESALLDLYERLSRRLFTKATKLDALVKMDYSEIIVLKDLIGLLIPLPEPWLSFLQTDSRNWVSWASLDQKLLTWCWHLKPLEPFQELSGLFSDQPVLFLNGAGSQKLLLEELESVACSINVKVQLGEQRLLEPISLFAPYRQPMPNNPIYVDYLLDQCRRLILGCSGITIVLLDDQQLRLQLTSELASEFGRRVVHEITAPESNGVVCCCWSWWLNFQDQLPLPDQLIVALLPLPSLEVPLISARVQSFKSQGRDWFRDFLLPEALSILPKALLPIRESRGRLAILDGRLRARSWGDQVLRTIEPWTPLQRLLPK